MTAAEIKPGRKSTEFWVTVALAVAAFLADIGAAFSESHWGRAVAAIGANIALAIQAFGYSTSRGAVKAAAAAAR